MKKAILLLSLILVASLSGCVELLQQMFGVRAPEELPFKDDVITIEEYYVSDKTPYEGGLVVIEFLLKNNGEEPTQRVEVGFDVPGFIIKELDCEFVPVDKLSFSGESGVCIFDGDNAIESLIHGGERRVIITMQVRDIGILHPQIYTIIFYIEYDYSGFRKMDIPIIDGVTIKKPMSQYSESTATYGPILLTFEAPLRGERVEDSQTIKEYWGVRDSPFRVGMKFTHVGSAFIGEVKDTKIEVGKVKLDSRGSLETASVEGTQLPCEFCRGGETGCIDEKGYLFSNKEVKIPGELMCNFQSLAFDEPETIATVWVEYYYTYHYTNSQQFEVQPLT